MGHLAAFWGNFGSHSQKVLINFPEKLCFLNGVSLSSFPRGFRVGLPLRIRKNIDIAFPACMER